MFKWIVTALVIVQMVSLPLIQHLSWPALLLTAYCFGGVINHCLMLGKNLNCNSVYAGDSYTLVLLSHDLVSPFYVLFLRYKRALVPFL